jgi:hypothetical protein
VSAAPPAGETIPYIERRMLPDPIGYVVSSQINYSNRHTEDLLTAEL